MTPTPYEYEIVEPATERRGEMRCVYLRRDGELNLTWYTRASDLEIAEHVHALNDRLDPSARELFFARALANVKRGRPPKNAKTQRD